MAEGTDQWRISVNTVIKLPGFIKFGLFFD